MDCTEIDPGVEWRGRLGVVHLAKKVSALIERDEPEIGEARLMMDKLLGEIWWSRRTSPRALRRAVKMRREIALLRQQVKLLGSDVSERLRNSKINEPGSFNGKDQRK